MCNPWRFAPVALLGAVLAVVLPACGSTPSGAPSARHLQGAVDGWVAGTSATVCARSLVDGAPVGPAGRIAADGMLELYLPGTVSAVRLASVDALASVCPGLTAEPADARLLVVSLDVRRGLGSAGALTQAAQEGVSEVRVYASREVTLSGTCARGASATRARSLARGWNALVVTRDPATLRPCLDLVAEPRQGAWSFAEGASASF